MLLLQQNIQMIDMFFVMSLIVVFYFFFLRPNAKRAKEQGIFIQNLEKGMPVVTAGGIHGRISKVDERTITIEVYNKTYLTVEKSTINMEMSKSASETANVS